MKLKKKLTIASLSLSLAFAPVATTLSQAETAKNVSASTIIYYRRRPSALESGLVGVGAAATLAYALSRKVKSYNQYRNSHDYVYTHKFVIAKKYNTPLYNRHGKKIKVKGVTASINKGLILTVYKKIKVHGRTFYKVSKQKQLYVSARDVKNYKFQKRNLYDMN